MLQDILGPSEPSDPGSSGRTQLLAEATQATASSQASATGTAAAHDEESATLTAQLPANPIQQAAESSHSDAAVSSSAMQDPKSSSATSPQSSFPGFQVGLQADDAASSPEPVGTLQQVELHNTAKAHTLQAGSTTPARQARNGWGALFSPDRSPGAGVVQSVAKSNIASPIISDTPGMMARGTPPPAPATEMQTPWDALFSSPGGPPSPQPTLATNDLSAGATSEPRLVSGRPLVAPTTQQVPNQQTTDHQLTADRGHGGGFVALLEASLTELAGPAQASEDQQAGTSSSSNKTGMPPAVEGDTSRQRTSPADAVPGKPVQQQAGGSEATSMQPESATRSAVQQDAEHVASFRPQSKPPAPGPSISLDMVLPPPQPQMDNTASPLTSEATLTMQQDEALQSELPLMGTPSWGWDMGASPQQSLQAGLAASPAGPGLRADAAGQVSGTDTVVPASPAESVGSAKDPLERLQGAAPHVRSLLPSAAHM